VQWQQEIPLFAVFSPNGYPNILRREGMSSILVRYWLGQRSRTASVMPGGAPPSEAGLSLLECLMAIAIIVLSVAMIAPPLFIATATRVQNRRAEQALQIAQGEVDRLQVLMSRNENIAVRLPVSVGSSTALDTWAPPTGPATAVKSVNSTCNTYQDQQISASLALPVDADGDCTIDFYMQSFRTAGSIPQSEQGSTNPKITDFEVEVRVYSSLVTKNGWTGLQQEQVNLNLTSGEGSRRTRPLVVLNNRMSWSDRTFSLCELQQNLPGGAGC